MWLFLIAVVFGNPVFGSPLPFRVVIDPGHGGSDQGTVYHRGHYRLTEKNVTLQLARRIASELRKKHYFVALTRNSDREVSLPARTSLANHFGADIFISIHMNSTESLPSKNATGIETFILNNTTDASSRRLARLENSILTAQKLQNSPEQTDVALILKDLRLDANLSESKLLACSVQNKLVHATSSNSRGVKQALFHVLLGADMPSILVEAGFLNNKRDRNWVTSKAGQLKISQAIASAIEEYQAHQLSKTSKSSATLSRCKVN